MKSLAFAGTRRHWLCSSGLVAASVAMPCLAQSSRLQTQKNPVIAQIVDVSQGQQDVSKDFLVGSRAAWQDINQRGGIRGRQVQHTVIETEGSTEGIRTALNSVKSNSSCIVMSGSVGDQLAVNS